MTAVGGAETHRETFQAAGVVGRQLEDQYLGRVGLFRNTELFAHLHEGVLE